ncbi:tRNA pseudouridine synthase B [uncultured delta proteobacterium]|uniref:tRNA pseudouridine synthase B n=1 Tax=uncultured delta proteobacterium TaxID=34034 RepID=A0A212JGC9_9DELT|nr:tRNA pseudouridine synthase B [uncultured delta proteobacterium]
MDTLPFSCPQQDGVLVLHKPSGPTSAACIAKIKRRLGQKKIGHAGTLDPMASGVLLVLLGQGTKLSGHLMGSGEKIYAGTVLLGQTTDTWDAEGKIIARADPSAITPVMVEEAVSSFIGDTVQEVPPYSAAKHEGKPLYALARKGLDVPVKTKTVHVSDAAIEWVDLPYFRFRVACGSGTYIRSLAHSLGIRLQCGATLTELTREYSHPFGLEQAHNLDEVLATPEAFAGRVASIADALPSWQRIRLTESEAAQVRNGAALPFCGAEAAHALLEDAEGNPLALAKRVERSGTVYWAVDRGLWN